MEQNVFLKELKRSSLERDIPNISEQNALFLREIIAKNKYIATLEIGTANGYSTIHLALELQKFSGHITTIEFSPISYKEANENFEKVGVTNTVTSLLGNALDIIPTLQNTYDFIFIDGMKKRTLDFYLLIKDKINIGGTIVIDDVIKFGNGIGKNGTKMQNFYEYLKNNKISYEVIPIDGDDGIMIIKN